MPTQPHPEAQVVSAADANRQFSRLLREVRQGRSYIVTSHGLPVARLEPYAGPSPELVALRRAHLEELARRPALNAGPWTREEIYEEV